MQPFPWPNTKEPYLTSLGYGKVLPLMGQIALPHMSYWSCKSHPLAAATITPIRSRHD